VNKWVKPSKCSSNACVEVLMGDRYVGIRDSARMFSPIVFTYAEWREFIQAIKDGEYDV